MYSSVGPSSLWHALGTIWLFNVSDIKTIVFPITVFSQSLGHWHSFGRFCLVVAWIYFELLEFTVSNQTFGTSPLEDAQNKPYRPIPSQRISLANAKTLRFSLPALNVVFSSTIGSLPGSLGISLFTPLHNELGGSDHWLTKNACTAMLYACFETGATMIADSSPTLTTPQVAAVIGSACIIFTTIQAQDFCDVEGDAAQGRVTFPMMYPKVSRVTMPIVLIAWSFLLFYLSQVNIFILLALVATATWVGLRFAFLTTPKEDKASYLYYNIWLCVAHVALSRLDAEKLGTVRQVALSLII